MINDMDGAFNDLKTAIETARKKPDIIRINQSGEIINKEYLENWIQLATEFPHIKFWLYTKAFSIALPFLASGIVPDNFTVLFSIWHEYGALAYKSIQHLDNVKAFVYCDGYGYTKDDIAIQTYCEAYKEVNGKMRLNHNITCDKCKKCFNRSAACKVIGCLAH